MVYWLSSLYPKKYRCKETAGSCNDIFYILKSLRDSVPLNTNINTGINILQNGKESGEIFFRSMVCYIIIILLHHCQGHYGTT